MQDMKQQKLLCGGMMIFIALLAFNFSSAFADIVIKNGSTMKVSSGTAVVVSSDITVESGGTVDNSGTVTVKGNFSNSGTADLGSGEVVFSGTVAQTIGGTTVSEFEDLTINNAAGVSLGVGALVEGTLTLTDGLFDAAASPLTFGAAATAVAGTPSASNMIIVSGAGEVRKAYADGTLDPAAFIFPIGSDDGTAEYSPISIDFGSSTFASAYVGVTVNPTKETNNTSTTNYLNRFWTITESGITAGYTYDLLATYVDADIVGTEASINGALWTGTDWLIGDPVTTANNTFAISGLTEDGNTTGVEFKILSDLKVFCQGPFNAGSDEMSTAINSYIPLDAATAYSNIGYAGTESVTSIPNADVVDWILVELRDATDAASANSGTILQTIAGFLLKTGYIVGLDGVSPIKFEFDVTNNAYFVIHHRNHLPIMTSSTPTESFGNYVYNFSDNATKAYGTDAMKQIDTSPVTYGMYAGDANGNGVVDVADYSVSWALDFGKSGDYYNGDFNMNGAVDIADYSTMWALSFGRTRLYP
jgi:hypothetical protein